MNSGAGGSFFSLTLSGMTTSLSCNSLKVLGHFKSFRFFENLIGSFTGVLLLLHTLKVTRGVKILKKCRLNKKVSKKTYRAVPYEKSFLD